MMTFYSFGTSRKIPGRHGSMRRDPKPPDPPLSRVIREGTIGDCPKCHSTTVKRFIWFGMSIGCIQPKCENYYKKIV